MILPSREVRSYVSQKSRAGFWCAGEDVSQQEMDRGQLLAYSRRRLSVTREVWARGGHTNWGGGRKVTRLLLLRKRLC